MSLDLLKSSQNLNSWSLTAKSIVAAFLPVLKNLFGIEILNKESDVVIDAVFTLISLGLAIYGYTRAKRTAEVQLGALRAQLGATRSVETFCVKHQSSTGTQCPDCLYEKGVGKN